MQLGAGLYSCVVGVLKPGEAMCALEQSSGWVWGANKGVGPSSWGSVATPEECCPGSCDFPSYIIASGGTLDRLLAIPWSGWLVMGLKLIKHRPSAVEALLSPYCLKCPLF